MASQMAGLVSALQMQMAAMSAQMQAMHKEMSLEAPLPAPLLLTQPEMMESVETEDGAWTDSDSGDETGDDIVHAKEKLRKLKEKKKLHKRKKQLLP